MQLRHESGGDTSKFLMVVKHLFCTHTQLYSPAAPGGTRCLVDPKKNYYILSCVYINTLNINSFLYYIINLH